MELFSLESFSHWLYRNTELHKNSIYRYVNAVKIISESSEIISVGPFFQIFELDKLQKIEELYFSNPENKRKNEDGNNMYSAAFHHYQNYVQQLAEITFPIEQEKYLENQELDILVENQVFDETKKKYYKHLKTERKTSLTNKAKKIFKKENGVLFCECCKFNENNSEQFGELIIEGHHLIPVENLTDINISSNTILNIMLLCPNCHKKVHIFMRNNNLVVMSKNQIIDEIV